MNFWASLKRPWNLYSKKWKLQAMNFPAPASKRDLLPFSIFTNVENTIQTSAHKIDVKWAQIQELWILSSIYTAVSSLWGHQCFKTSNCWINCGHNLSGTTTYSSIFSVHVARICSSFSSHCNGTCHPLLETPDTTTAAPNPCFLNLQSAQWNWVEKTAVAVNPTLIYQPITP